MNPRYVIVMADHASTGLWDSDGKMVHMAYDPFTNISSILPIAGELNLTWILSKEIQKRLLDWVIFYDKHSDTYMDESERTGTFDLKAFSEDGLEIAKAIKAELGEHWIVDYYDEYMYYKTLDPKKLYRYEVKI